MSKSSAFSSDMLSLIFQGLAISGIADNAATPLAGFSLAAHTANPGVGGSQATSEATYVGYARVTVPRNPFSWTVTAGSPSSAVLATTVPWPQSLDNATQVLTHFSLGMPGTGPTKIFYSGTLTPNITVTLGLVPELQAGTTITEA